VRYGEWEEEIDAAIAPLILELWKAGIDTYQSCQGNPLGWIWLPFPTSLDMERFLSLAAGEPAEGDDMHRRIPFGYGDRGFPRADHWQYEAVVFDAKVDVALGKEGEVQTVRLGPADFRVLICVHFPEADLPLLLRRLVRHNQRHQQQAADEETACTALRGPGDIARSPAARRTVCENHTACSACDRASVDWKKAGGSSPPSSHRSYV
jgi:hypothetical protein